MSSQAFWAWVTGGSLGALLVSPFNLKSRHSHRQLRTQSEGKSSMETHGRSPTVSKCCPDFIFLKAELFYNSSTFRSRSFLLIGSIFLSFCGPLIQFVLNSNFSKGIVRRKVLHKAFGKWKNNLSR
jgi:hypothetical protein